MIVAAIPTRYYPPTLAPLLDVLKGDGVAILLMDTKDRPPAIYEWWNQGTRAARALGATEIAILNDDIIIAPGTLPALAAALRSDERVALVCPSFGRVSVTEPTSLLPVASCVPSNLFCCFPGWAFMFKAEIDLPEFDEEYRWFGGDDAFANDVEAAGWKVMGARNVRVDHLGSWSDKRRTADAGTDPVASIKVEDRQHWAARPRACPGWRPKPGGKRPYPNPNYRGS